MSRKSLAPHVMMGTLGLLIGGSILAYGLSRNGETTHVVLGAIALALALYRFCLVGRVLAWRSRHPEGAADDEGDGTDEGSEEPERPGT
ncbi:MAG: hypothetical protein AAB215_08845 [Planctomycetota bacterium]